MSMVSANAREVAIMIDGGFLTKRLSKSFGGHNALTPNLALKAVQRICMCHMQWLVGGPEGLHHPYLKGAYYYDCPPLEETVTHPVSGDPIDLKWTDRAIFQREWLRLLKRQSNIRVYQGTLTGRGWASKSVSIAYLLQSQPVLSQLGETNLPRRGDLIVPREFARSLLEVCKRWARVRADDVRYEARQKNVDMALAIEMVTLASGGAVSTIVLIAGDADFAMAAEYVRRTGVRIILDSLGQSVRPELKRQVDQQRSAFGYLGSDGPVPQYGGLN